MTRIYYIDMGPNVSTAEAAQRFKSVLRELIVQRLDSWLNGAFENLPVDLGGGVISVEDAPITELLPLPEICPERFDPPDVFENHTVEISESVVRFENIWAYEFRNDSNKLFEFTTLEIIDKLLDMYPETRLAGDY